MTKPYRHTITTHPQHVETRWWRLFLRIPGTNRGALLISLILTLTVMATLGAAMIYMTSSSGYGLLTSTSQQKAYYIAYSGLTYYDAQPVKPTLPQTYRLTNGDRFILDVDGVPERLSSTGVVSGPFGDTRVKLFARGSGGTPEWVDTMEDTDSWLPDEQTPGSLDTDAVDDNAALRTKVNRLVCQAPAVPCRFKPPSMMPPPLGMTMKVDATARPRSVWNGWRTIFIPAIGQRSWSHWKMHAPS